MTLGIISEFDFYPYYIELPKRWKRFYISISHIRPLLQSGKIDAVPCPYHIISFIPDEFVITKFYVVLTPLSQSLILVSREDINSLDNFTLGIVQGYEPILYAVEDKISSLFSGRIFKLKNFPDIFNADAFVVYGDKALRRDFDEYVHIYNLVDRELPLAVWVVRKGLEEEVVPYLGNSLAHWFMDMEKYVEIYAKRRKIVKEILLQHSRSLKFKYEG